MQVFGGEQFLAFFLTAGMVSSLTSYAGRLRSLKGGHSLGASGAVYACFAGMAILYPGMHAIVLPLCVHLHHCQCSSPATLRFPAYPQTHHCRKETSLEERTCSSVHQDMGRIGCRGRARLVKEGCGQHAVRPL